MDKTLSLKLNEFRKSIDSLKEVLSKEKNDIIRDSVIKRFEYCFELCWKTSKVFLSDKFGVSVFSPKECFRELRKNGLISDEQTELFLKMCNDRNEIIHIYNEDLSDEIYEKIAGKYYDLLEGVCGALENGGKEK